MKVGIYVTQAKYPTGASDIVSGHVQIALQTASILGQDGNEVTVITTPSPPDHHLPSFIPRIFSVRTLNTSGYFPSSGRINLIGLIWQVFEMKKLIEAEKFDVLHFFGANKTAYLSGLCKMVGVKIPTIMTSTNFKNFSSVERLILSQLFSKIEYFHVLTQYTMDMLVKSGCSPTKISVIRPGLVRNHSLDDDQSVNMSSLTHRPSVLFWRNATWHNGVDIAMKVCEMLCEDYKEIDFVFAYRSNDVYIEKLRRLANNHKNVLMYQTPFQNGIKIADLIRSAEVILLPFRSLSMNPQLVVLESMACGKPVVASAIESNFEVIENHETGVLVEETPDDYVLEVKNLLDNPDFAKTIGNAASATVQKRWNWESYKNDINDIYKKLI